MFSQQHVFNTSAAKLYEIHWRNVKRSLKLKGFKWCILLIQHLSKNKELLNFYRVRLPPVVLIVEISSGNLFEGLNEFTMSEINITNPAPITFNHKKETILRL